MDNYEPKISSEALVSLIAADPAREHTPRDLSEQAFTGAFDAWELAQTDVYAHWSKLPDPTAFDPQPPKSFRDAYAFVQRHGGKLSTEVQRKTLACPRTVTSSKIEGAMRDLRKGDDPTDKKVSRIILLLDDSGIQAIKRREPLPAVAEHEVRLVAWMAVSGTGSNL